MNTYSHNEIANYLSVFKKRKNTIILFTAVLTAVTSVISFAICPKYQATSTVLIDNETANILPVKDVLPLGTSDFWSYRDYFNTQIEMLCGRSIAAEVFRKYLDLKKHAKESKIGDKLRIFIECSEQLSESLDDMISSYNKTGNRIPIKSLIFEKELKKFRKKLKIFAVRDSRLINISFQDVNPEVASYIANNIAEIYVRLNLEKRQKISNEARIWLHNELDKLKKKLEESEYRLQEFRNKHNFISADERRDIINQNIVDLTKKLNDAEVSFAELNKRYRLKHPKMKQVIALVSALYDKVAEKRKEAILFEEKMIEYNTLVREVNLTKNLLENVLNREKETLISSSIVSNNVSIVEKAVPPVKPFKPNRLLNIILALLFGIFGGMIIALLFENLEEKICYPEDFEKNQIRFLGYIPHIKLPMLQKKIHKETYLFYYHRGIISELFNNIRTSILLSDEKQGETKSKGIVITSFIPGEGKTLFTCNLAVSLAKYKFKILIVESDLRKPRFANIFKINHEPGLSDFLMNDAAFEDIIRHTSLANLDIIVAGSIPENPSELLGNEKFIELKNFVESQYEVVLYDTPPVFAVTDPIIISSYVKRVIIITRYNFTPKKLVLKVKEKFSVAKCEIIGAVINDVIKGGSVLNTQYGSYSGYYGK